MTFFLPPVVILDGTDITCLTHKVQLMKKHLCQYEQHVCIPRLHAKEFHLRKQEQEIEAIFNSLHQRNSKRYTCSAINNLQAMRARIKMLSSTGKDIGLLQGEMANLRHLNDLFNIIEDLTYSVASTSAWYRLSTSSMIISSSGSTLALNNNVIPNATHTTKMVIERSSNVVNHPHQVVSSISLDMSLNDATVSYTRSSSPSSSSRTSRGHSSTILNIANQLLSMNNDRESFVNKTPSPSSTYSSSSRTSRGHNSTILNIANQLLSMNNDQESFVKKPPSPSSTYSSSSRSSRVHSSTILNIANQLLSMNNEHESFRKISSPLSSSMSSKTSDEESPNPDNHQHQLLSSYGLDEVSFVSSYGLDPPLNEVSFGRTSLASSTSGQEEFADTLQEFEERGEHQVLLTVRKPSGGFMETVHSTSYTITDYHDLTPERPTSAVTRAYQVVRRHVNNISNVVQTYFKGIVYLIGLAVLLVCFQRISQSGVFNCCTLETLISSIIEIRYDGEYVF